MRPQTVQDLTANQREGREFLRVSLANLPVDGSIIAAVGQLIELVEIAAENGTATVELTTYRDFVATTVLTEDELQQALQNAQATWDFQQQRYEESRQTRLLPASNYGLLAWCQAEGLTPPWYCPCGNPGVRLDETGVPICADEDAAVDEVQAALDAIIPIQPTKDSR